MNERTNVFSRVPSLAFPLPVSLALSLGLRLRRSGSKNRPFASQPSRRTEPAAFPSSRTSFHPRVSAARSLTRAYSRLRAYVCARTTRVCLASVACACRRRTTHTYTHTYTRNLGWRRKRREEKVYMSPSLSLYASRTAVPVSRNQRLRFLLIDLILSPLVSLFLSLFLPSCGPVVVSPSVPRGRCPTSFRSVFNETRRQRETNGESTTDQPSQSTNRTTLSTVHYRSTATSVH